MKAISPENNCQIENSLQKENEPQNEPLSKSANVVTKIGLVDAFTFEVVAGISPCTGDISCQPPTNYLLVSSGKRGGNEKALVQAGLRRPFVDRDHHPTGLGWARDRFFARPRSGALHFLRRSEEQRRFGQGDLNSLRSSSQRQPGQKCLAQSRRVNTAG